LPGDTDAVNYYFHDKGRRGGAAERGILPDSIINASDDNRGADLIGQIPPPDCGAMRENKCAHTV